MIYVGIDPGKSGYIVIVNPDRLLAGVGPTLVAYKIPVFTVGKTKKEFDRKAIKGLLETIAEELASPHVVIEHQQVMPGNGKNGNFSTGYGYGLLTMALEGVLPYTEVRPTVWKKQMGLTIPAKDMKGMSVTVKTKRKKALALREAQRLFPNETFIPDGCRVPSADMAEATLLAVYGKRKSL